METMTPSSFGTRARMRFLRALGPPMILVLVVCAIWSIARLTGADQIPLLARPLIPLLAFTPYAALISIVPAIWAAALRHWTAFGVAMAVVSAFSLAVLPRAVDDSTPAAKGPLVRVLTANLRLGNADPQVLVNLVRRSHADVLSLQEFTFQAAVRLDKAGLGALLPYKVAAPAASGALGSGIYARYPLRALPMPDVAVVGLAMPRAEVDLPGGGRVEVMAVHMARPVNLPGVAQWALGLAAVPVAEPHTTVRIVAGDFNGTLDNARVRRLIGAAYVDAADAVGTGLVPTFQKWGWPPITIDHVLVDARCAVRHVAVYDLPRSDHRAVFAELRLP
ncbi:MAG: Endonuclease/exonuclease/phosphatase [Actinomycetia bacterium]|nr:Endonuclease/exonuclease/phosphatase [Actinomycetes bacterium]